MQPEQIGEWLCWLIFYFLTFNSGSESPEQFPTDASAMKVVYLVIQAAAKKWTMPIHDRKPAMSRFIIEFDDRLNGHL